MSTLDLAPYRGQCRSCRAPIVWARCGDDDRMPVDPAPAPNGNVQLAIQGRALFAAVLSAKDARRRRAIGLPLHVSHFTTCPDASQHRRHR